MHLFQGGDVRLKPFVSSLGRRMLCRHGSDQRNPSGLLVWIIYYIKVASPLGGLAAVYIFTKSIKMK
jgi:hypothetical protein